MLPEVERVLRDEFPGIEIRLSSDYSPVLAKALIRRKHIEFKRICFCAEFLGNAPHRPLTCSPMAGSAARGGVDG